MFLLVSQHLLVRVKESIRQLRLCVRPYCTSCSSYLVLEKGGKWPYSCCFMWCCFQDLINMARSIFVQFSSSFFFIRLVSIQVVHQYSSIDTTDVCKKMRFDLSDKRSDFHLIDNPSIAVHIFTSRILMSFSLDETLLPRYVNLSSNFREPPFRVYIYIYISSSCHIASTDLADPLPSPVSIVHRSR